MQTAPDLLAERLRAEGKSAADFFRQLPEAAWQVELYDSGGAWCMRDLLAHFITAEQGFLELIQNIAAGGAGVEPNFDIDAYNRSAVAALREVQPAVMLDQFAVLRERTAALVVGLPPEMLTRRGRHPHLGDTDLESMIRLVYNHNNLHLRDARRVLRAGEVRK